MENYENFKTWQSAGKGLTAVSQSPWVKLACRREALSPSGIATGLGAPDRTLPQEAPALLAQQELPGAWVGPSAGRGGGSLRRAGGSRSPLCATVAWNIPPPPPPTARREAGPAAAPGRLAGARAVGDPAHTSLPLGAALAAAGSRRTGAAASPAHPG